MNLEHKGEINQKPGGERGECGPLPGKKRTKGKYPEKEKPIFKSEEDWNTQNGQKA